MKKDIHILMLEDDRADAELARFALRKGGLNFSLARVETRDQYVRALEQHAPELILSDYSLPGFDGYEALKIAQRKCPEIPFIFVTGTMGEEVAIETLKRGATDYVLKTRLSRLTPAVHRALRETRERVERRRAEAQLRQSHQQLRALSEYLQSVREDERTRIAREVHDGLGQALTSAKMGLSWIAGKLPAGLGPLHAKTRALAEHLDATIQLVRRIATELRPGVLDHLGLTAALEWQAQEFQVRTGIHCRVRATVREPLPGAKLSTTLFRIFQETLTNVVRHAGATRVTVHLNERAGQIILEVKDNGRGISESEVSDPRSLGLLGMRERASLLGGTFKIQSLPRRPGAKVTVSIPLPRGAATNRSCHEDTLSRRSRRGAPRLETNSR